MILVVDDDRLMRDVATLHFRSKGEEVVTCDSAAQALELLRSLRPDAIVVDYRLPEMSGIALLRIIKRESELGAIPVFLVTGDLLITEEDAAKEGAAGLFTKGSAGWGELARDVIARVRPVGHD
jgi:CheY-like chemotaxis protein